MQYFLHLYAKIVEGNKLKHLQIYTDLLRFRRLSFRS